MEKTRPRVLADRGGRLCKVRGTVGENRWYDRGDLHRACGPAVEGVEAAAYRYWYYRGVLGRGPASTRTDALSGSEAREPFECAPKALVCAEVPLYGDMCDVARVYQNADTRVIEVREAETRNKCGTCIHTPFPLSEPAVIRAVASGSPGRPTMRNLMLTGCSRCNAWAGY